MVSFLRSLIAKFTGGENPPQDEPPGEAVEYKGFRLRAAPFAAKGQYQTAGLIEKDTPEGVKEHRFVRADTLPSRDEAAEFAIRKAKQIVDEQGDRIFG
jgi:hypothetical protein